MKKARLSGAVIRRFMVSMSADYNKPAVSESVCSAHDPEN
jgi:hypothetical protein